MLSSPFIAPNLVVRESSFSGSISAHKRGQKTAVSML
jgi:hypothetical protein